MQSDHDPSCTASRSDPISNSAVPSVNTSSDFPGVTRITVGASGSNASAVASPVSRREIPTLSSMCGRVLLRYFLLRVTGELECRALHVR